MYTNNGFFSKRTRRVRNQSYVGIGDSLHIGLESLLDLHSNLTGNTLIAAESSTAVTTDRALPVVNDDPR